MISIPTQSNYACPGRSQRRFRHVNLLLLPSMLALSIFAIVFSGGASSQTNIDTDGGEFARNLKEYLSNGGAGVK